jgi:cyclopropane fatty-acyl-phospholipid synthase-like methyltransferase
MPIKHEWYEHAKKPIDKVKEAIYTPLGDSGGFPPDFFILDEFDFEGKKVLDYGCGVGRNSKYIISKEPSGLFCLDSKEMLHLLIKDINPEDIYMVEYERKDVILSQDNYFDIILATLVFQHMPPESIEEDIKFVHRVLKCGGIFIMYGRDCLDRWNCEPYIHLFDKYFIKLYFNECESLDGIYPHSCHVYTKECK